MNIIPRMTKRQNESFAVGLKYVAPDLEEGLELAAAQVTITPDEVGGVKTVGNVVIEPDTVSQVINGGNDNTEYKVAFLVTTSGGHIYEDFIFVKVREF